MTTKTPPKTIRYEELEYKPRFDYGHMAKMCLMVGEADGAELATGWGRMTKAKIPWTITYDEIIMVVEGELKVHCNGTTQTAGPRDSIWLPAGTELVYEAEDALIFWAVTPAGSPKKRD